MQSIIIASKNLDKGFEKALDFVQKKKIGKFDIEVLEFEKAMGIADVRLLKSKIFLKPLGEEKAVILKLLDGATIEAQNAMLKLLEEPPPSANLILIAQSEEIFLPTVLSRCKILKVDKQETKKEIANLKVLEKADLNEGFLIAQNISKDRKEAVGWLEEAIVFCKDKLEENVKRGDFETAKKYSDKLKILLETYDTAKNTNVNLRLTLENLFLTFAE